jgi:hypothetical protein
MARLTAANCGTVKQAVPAQLQPALTSDVGFKPADLDAKPPLEDLFGLGTLQSGDSSVLLIERNMVTRDIFVFARLGDVLHENAFSARMRT